VSRIGVAEPNLGLEAEVDADVATLATALYVTSDDFLADNPQHRPWRPRVGLAPRLSDAELVTLVVLQALLGFTSEARFLRYAKASLRGMFPYLPTQSGYSKRIRAATGLLRAVIAYLVACTSRSSDDVWVVDSTRSGAGVRGKRRNVPTSPGRPSTVYCASHSRFFWGLRLHLLCTLSGLPVAFALAGAKADEREVLLAIFEADPNLVAARPKQKLMADKNYYGKAFEATLARCRAAAPGPQGRETTARTPLLQAVPAGHRVDQQYAQDPVRPGTPRWAHHRRSRIASTATHPRPHCCDLHNDQLGRPTLRSLTAYDH
jgi:hypothetical protein